MIPTGNMVFRLSTIPQKQIIIPQWVSSSHDFPNVYQIITRSSVLGIRSTWILRRVFLRYSLAKITRTNELNTICVLHFQHSKVLPYIKLFSNLQTISQTSNNLMIPKKLFDLHYSDTFHDGKTRHFVNGKTRHFSFSLQFPFYGLFIPVLNS